MTDQGQSATAHSTVRRYNGQACRMVADICDRDARGAYSDLLNVLPEREGPKVRFEIVSDAGIWKDPPVLEALQRYE